MNDQPIMPPTQASPKRLGLAIASVVFAILGLIHLLPPIICSPIALIIGIVAVIKINRSHGQLLGQGLAFFGIALSVLGIVFAMSALAVQHERMQRAICAKNMRLLQDATVQYLSDHNGFFPRNIHDLDSYVNTKTLVCPASQDKTAESYILVLGGTNLTQISQPAITPSIIERNGNHSNKGGNVVFADGHIEWVQTRPPVVSESK